MVSIENVYQWLPMDRIIGKKHPLAAGTAPSSMFGTKYGLYENGAWYGIPNSDDPLGLGVAILRPKQVTTAKKQRPQNLRPHWQWLSG